MRLLSGAFVIVELAFIDSTGLAASVAVRNRLGPERFELNPGETVRRILELSGTEDYVLDCSRLARPEGSHCEDYAEIVSANPT